MTIADSIIKFAKTLEPSHLEGYMERYWLIPVNKFNIAARFHHFLSSDKDTFHDHPWSFLTIIIKGGYWELTPQYDESNIYIGEKRTWRKAGSVLFRKHSYFHRIEVAEGIDAWTLFIMFKKKQKWGFLANPNHKVGWDRHLKDKNDTAKNKN